MENLSELRELYGVTVVVFGGALFAGMVFGWLGERSDYCARSAFDEVFPTDNANPGAPSNQLWQVAIASLTAILGVYTASQFDLIDTSKDMLNVPTINFLGLFLGSFLFGIGMALSRGCISRLLILTGRGNIRAFITLMFTAFFAWASISGVLATSRIYLATLAKYEAPDISQLLFGLWTMVIIAMIALVIRRGGPEQIIKRTAMAIGIGALVPICFFVTSRLGADEFEPVGVEALRFTAPIVDSLNYIVYSTALTPKFGVGLVIGVLAGATTSALLAGRTKIEGFYNAPHPLRYIIGAFFMGFGGVIAGGCTVGWLLSGASVMNGGVVIAFLGFMAGNYSLRLRAFNAIIKGDAAPSQV
jgi:uncharacterized membrane protein YedE/YeeE